MASSYFRFGENLSKKFWGMKGMDPFCGKISLKKGASMFTWFNLVCWAFLAISSAIVLIIGPGKVLEDLHNYHHDTKVSNKNVTSITTINESVAKNASELLNNLSEEFETVEICVDDGFIRSLTTDLLLGIGNFYCSWKLNRAIKGEDLPTLKTFFVWTVAMIVSSAPAIIYEEEIAWVKAFLCDIPIFMFQVIGAIATHAFIVKLKNSVAVPQIQENI